jgi:hypothetical protein
MQITNQESFKSKRFLTASALSGNRLVTFGGCHSEYEHVNDLDMFDLSEFVASNCQNMQVKCIKLNKLDKISQSPSSRWGHSASVF